jgi:hypothetical protein
MTSVPSGLVTVTGSISKGTAQYSANMHTTISSTIFAFVLGPVERGKKAREGRKEGRMGGETR